MPKRKKKKKRYGLLLLAAAAAAAVFYFFNSRPENRIKDSLKIEDNINRALLKLGIPEQDIVSQRVEKNAGGKRWIFIGRDVRVEGRAPAELAKKVAASGLISGTSGSGYTVSHTACEVTVKNAGLVFAGISFTAKKRKPMLCIVLDDCGASRRKLVRFTELGVPLTFSILPYQRHTALIAESLARSGYETLLHLPMEPHNPDLRSMGKGGLFIKMSAAEIKKTVLADLERVPLVKGVNNHMGSLFTENAEKMAVVLDVLKKKKLFFLDSATSSHSVSLKTAAMTGTPCLRNSLFIDNVDNAKKIEWRIKEAVDIAARKGYAVAIGHVTRKHTAEAIRNSSKALSRVEMVTLKRILASKKEKTK